MIKLKSIIEGKYDVYTAKELTFVTYGGLSATKQHGFGKDSFHAPPARKGIYAFVWPYIERFLLGGYNSPRGRGKGQRNRVEYVRDEKGNVVDSEHSEYEKYSQISKNWTLPYWKDTNNYNQKALSYDDDYIQPDKYVLYRHIAPKKFKYNGEIWHHLKDYVNPNSILKQNGDWIKTDMNSFVAAFKKAAPKTEFSTQRNPITYSMDHLEVFIEGKI
jgi:hypothetical protein